jgi:hypothetical protein
VSAFRRAGPGPESPAGEEDAVVDPMLPPLALLLVAATIGLLMRSRLGASRRAAEARGDNPGTETTRRGRPG